MVGQQFSADVGDSVVGAAGALDRSDAVEIRQRPVAAIDPLLLPGGDGDSSLLVGNPQQLRGSLHDAP